MTTSIRQLTRDDLSALVTLYRANLVRDPNELLIEDEIAAFPSAGAFIGSQLIGFVIGAYSAPDVIELANIVVDRSRRDSGIGTLLLTEFEAQADRTYRAIILSNSMLYKNADTKRPARIFYERNGYREIAKTNSTVYFWKDLI